VHAAARHMAVQALQGQRKQVKGWSGRVIVWKISSGEACEVRCVGCRLMSDSYMSTTYNDAKLRT